MTPLRLREIGSLSGSTRSMIAMAFACLFAIYFLYPLEPVIQGRTITGWAWLACNSMNGFLHGRLVVFIFPILVWIAWQRSKDKTMSPSGWGLLWMGIGFLFFLVSLRIEQPRWAVAGAPFVVVGLSHFLFGWEITKPMIFPAFFLWFAIPIPGIENYMAGYPRVFTADLSYHVGRFLGMDLATSKDAIEVAGTEVAFGIG